MKKQGRHLRLPHIAATTARLAVSYLAIIMLLSGGFSVVFYWTSTKGLDPQKKISVTGNSGSVEPDRQLLIAGTHNSGQPEAVIANSAEELQAQFQDRVAAIQTDLRWRLLILNVVALAGGGILSLYLARCTLRPIEAAIEAQQRFASDASHELRTPLTIMQTEIEVVLGKQKLSLTRAKDALESNYQEVVRLRQLSEGLLQLARSSQPIPPHKLGVVTIDEAVNDAVNQVIKLAQAKHVTIHTAVPRMLARGEYQAVQQILTILLDNAVKYSVQGGAVTVEGRESRGYITLGVRDEGRGVPIADLPHIFERFYRAKYSTSKQETKGYGLGLSIAKGLAEQHGGTITVESTPKKGALFTLKLLKL
jgi:signal transduction histidine kinase